VFELLARDIESSLVVYDKVNPLIDLPLKTQFMISSLDPYKTICNTTTADNNGSYINNFPKKTEFKIANL
jgi:hypothetical protein